MISTDREWLHRVDFYRPRFARQVGSKAESPPIAKVKRRPVGQILRENPSVERKKFRFHVYITKLFSKRSGAVNNDNKIKTDLNVLLGLTA